MTHSNTTQQSHKGDGPMIRLGITDLSFHRMTGALVAATLELRGYRVTRSYASHEANFARLASGEIDVLASAWLPSSHGIYKEQVEQQVDTRELGLHYQPYALWGVPDYVPADQVAEVADLLRPEVRTRMTPVIQGIGPGAGISRFSRQIMAEYGLEAAGYRFLNGSQEECLAAYERAVAEERWAVVPLWRPQFLHATYRIRELKEPKGLLGGVDRAVLLARSDRLHLLASEDINHLDRLRFDNSTIEQLDYRVNRLGEPLDQVARSWLES
ncbi:glycine betaine ABC transporter substrate-binding protein [Aeromonas veronii]|uniref:glycine betaine ABC transporter substrate-binding protein n=1 Tax=Aeromonas veronii TaxID=654 RepID=UPI003B52C35C